MKPLEPPDTHYLSAAIGWLELENPTEAEAELAQIQPPFQGHPDVLEVRWQLHAQAQRWDQALAMAETLVQTDPTCSTGWVHRAYALRRVPGGGLQAAWDSLLPAAEKFPDEPIIPYNLACYAAQLGQTEKAWTWLTRALKMDRGSTVRQTALADPDLQPLWDRLRRRE